MKQVYDSIAENYKQAIDNSFKRRCTLEETFFNYLGDVKRKSILDLGCGEGYYSRSIKKLGATQVIGVDISQKMITLAQAQEKRYPLGIKYERYNAAKLPKIGEFDIVTAAYLLHYSRTKEELFKICRNIYTNLKDEGRIIALNLNPLNPLQTDNKYDSTITAVGPLEEGSLLKVTLYFNGRETCVFNNYHWKKETYEAAFKVAGFKNIKWQKIIVSKEGIKKFGSEFWQNYLKQPGVIVIECNK